MAQQPADQLSLLQQASAQGSLAVPSAGFIRIPPGTVKGCMHCMPCSVRPMAQPCSEQLTMSATCWVRPSCEVHGTASQYMMVHLKFSSLVVQACEVYGTAAGLQPSSYSALYNWGVALSDIARIVRPQQAEEAYECLAAAAEKYARALEANPANPQASRGVGLEWESQSLLVSVNLHVPVLAYCS